MFTFYKEYPEFLILPMPVAKLETDTISPTPSAELEDTSILQLPVAKSKSKIGQLPVAQLENTEYQQYLIRNTGWAQHSVLIQKVKDLPTRYWYMQQTISNSWSYDILVEMIKSNLYMR